MAHPFKADISINIIIIKQILQNILEPHLKFIITEERCLARRYDILLAIFNSKINWESSPDLHH